MKTISLVLPLSGGISSEAQNQKFRSQTGSLEDRWRKRTIATAKKATDLFNARAATMLSDAFQAPSTAADADPAPQPADIIPSAELVALLQDCIDVVLVQRHKDEQKTKKEPKVKKERAAYVNTEDCKASKAIDRLPVVDVWLSKSFYMDI